MAPRNSDFPDYRGIRTEHVNGWNAIDYHSPKSSTRDNSGDASNGPQPIKGMVSNRKRRVHNDPPSQNIIDETSKAAQRDWRSRGLTNTKIEDN